MQYLNDTCMCAEGNKRCKRGIEKKKKKLRVSRACVGERKISFFAILFCWRPYACCACHVLLLYIRLLASYHDFIVKSDIHRRRVPKTGAETTATERGLSPLRCRKLPPTHGETGARRIETTVITWHFLNSPTTSRNCSIMTLMCNSSPSPNPQLRHAMDHGHHYTHCFDHHASPLLTCCRKRTWDTRSSLQLRENYSRNSHIRATKQPPPTIPHFVERPHRFPHQLRIHRLRVISPRDPEKPVVGDIFSTGESVQRAPPQKAACRYKGGAATAWRFL